MSQLRPLAPSSFLPPSQLKGQGKLGGINWGDGEVNWEGGLNKSGGGGGGSK